MPCFDIFQRNRSICPSRPESVSRTLTSLEERGIITRGEKGHVVLLINGGLWEED